MVLIPGVIESCTNYIEHPALVAERIVKVAELVGRERVVAGTDCGFGTWVGMARVDPRRRLGEAGQPGRGRSARLEGTLGLSCQTWPASRWKSARSEWCWPHVGRTLAARWPCRAGGPGSELPSTSTLTDA